uniref:G-protein coupled receptors family 1 profile domain-containing protein n=1 Tax=Electrophorus electricus TaxID=8005 RepID=A0A4W4ER37_ELEEL
MNINMTLHAVKLLNVSWQNNNFSTVRTKAALSEQGEIFVGVYLLVLCGYFSFVGNGIVILVLHKQRLILQPTDLLMLNLAITDAAIAVYVITWIWTCQVNGFLTLLFGLSSINTLTAIRVTRYLKEYHANKGYSVSRSTILISIIFIWKGTLFWSMATLLGLGGYTVARIQFKCTNLNCIHEAEISIYFIHICIRNAMLVNGYFSERQRSVERDMTRVSIAISTAFILAWSPYAIMCIHSAWGRHMPNEVRLFTCLWANPKLSWCQLAPHRERLISPRWNC